MNRTENVHRRSASHLLRAGLFAAAALWLLCSQAGSASAQWATNGNNVSNTNTGNVGVGTASPGTKLDIAPPAGHGLLIRSTGSDTNTSDLMISNRGIDVMTAGWNSPNTFLANFGSASGVSGTNSGGVLMNVGHTLDGHTNSLLTLYNRNQSGLTQTGYFMRATGSAGSTKFSLDALGSAFFAGQVNASGGLCLAGDCKTSWTQVGAGQWTTSGANISYSTGRVGIGTAAPASLLQVQSAQPDVTLNHTNTANYSRVLFQDNGSERAAFQYIGSTFATVGRRGAMEFINNFGPVAFYTHGAGAGAERMRIDASGNVGVGTASPAVKLAVNGAGANVYGTDAWVENNLHAQGNEALTQGGRGRVRVGTAWGYAGLYTDASSTGGANDLVLGASSGVVRIGPGLPTVTQSLIIPDGSLAVGASSAPASAKLHVAGNINATGNITADGSIAAKYQDVAEWVPSSQRLSPGTVVTLDPALSNHVLASASAYDTAVAGVVSEQPGLILGEGGEGKVKVATTGRVRVKVDATKGPIRIGDLLVTSDVAGVAMKSEAVSLGGVLIHRPGTIVGKALEPLAGGVGEILVLLSLQ